MSLLPLQRRTRSVDNPRMWPISSDRLRFTRLVSSLTSMRGPSARNSVVTGEPQSGPSGITRLNASILNRTGTRSASDVSEILARDCTRVPPVAGDRGQRGILPR